MKLRSALALCLSVLLLLPIPAAAAGAVTVTAVGVSQYVTKYTIAWTSTAGGAVSGNALGIAKGNVLQAIFVPGTAGTQPTDLYDAQLNTNTGVINLLGTTGDNLSNATSMLVQFVPPYYHDTTGELDLVISNAGNAKTGTLILWIQQ